MADYFKFSYNYVTGGLTKRARDCRTLACTTETKSPMFFHQGLSFGIVRTMCNWLDDIKTRIFQADVSCRGTKVRGDNS